MYEIWLMMNIAWELMLPAMPVLVVLLLAWVALMVRARFSGGVSWGGARACRADRVGGGCGGLLHRARLSEVRTL